MSSREGRRYKAAEEAKHDKNQLMFSSLGSLKPNPNIVVIAHETLLPLEKDVSCPFCLGLSEFRKFLISNKQGISRKLGKCPLCSCGMELDSLVKMSKFEAKGYAKWVFNYKGFFKKVPSFNTWKGRLQLMGWTQQFWDTYKQLKGEQQEEGGSEESFTDYVNRRGRETAEEWNKQESQGPQPTDQNAMEALQNG
jgi:hypothetical protein